MDGKPDISDPETIEPETIDCSIFEPPPESQAFYGECLRLLAQSGIPFLVSGTYALAAYTGIVRPTKDVDVFCKAGDFPKILAYFQERGYRIEVVDERWLARILREDGLFLDIIFNMPTTSDPITDQWFENTPTVRIYDSEVRLVPPTEFILSKAFVQDRYRYDGADVAHMFLKRSDGIDWHRLLSHFELYWEVLLIHVLNFRFVYPSERDNVPRWLFDELMARLQAQAALPPPMKKVCRGRMFSPRDYRMDTGEWGYSEFVGNLEEHYERR
jgi:hypothetical protein